MTLMVISVVAVFFFSFNFQTWLWVPLFVCTASIGIVKLLPKTVNEWIAWVGTISAALFVLHPLNKKNIHTNLSPRRCVHGSAAVHRGVDSIGMVLP